MSERSLNCRKSRIKPDTIHVEHDWWFPELAATDDLYGAIKCNCNVLFENNGPYDPAVGTDKKESSWSLALRSLRKPKVRSLLRSSERTGPPPQTARSRRMTKAFTLTDRTGRGRQEAAMKTNRKRLRSLPGKHRRLRERHEHPRSLLAVP